MPLPEHEIDVSGLPLTDFVEIIRDERGIPHIYGTNVDDILFNIKIYTYTNLQI